MLMLSRVVVAVSVMFIGLVGPLGAEEAAGTPPQVSMLPGDAPLPAIAAETLSLEVGEIWNLSVDGLERVALGDPKIADLTIVSTSEVLVQAKATGKTNLLVWDRGGQRRLDLTVVNRAAEREEAQLRQMIEELRLPQLGVNRKDHRLFLIGEVDRQEDLDRIEQMLSAFSSVVNLVQVSAVPAAPSVSPKLVKLSVQVLEISRSDLERLGVKWGESLVLTQPSLTDRTTTEALTRWGTGLTRGSYAATLSALIQQNKARVLAEPKLVTTSGKEASSFIGVDVPIPSSSSTVGTAGTTVSTAVEFRQTGVTLRMTPTVREDSQGRSRISTVVQAELTEIDDSVAITIQSGSSAIAVPGFKVKKTSTEVTLAPGESVAVAGLFEAKDSYTSSQVPALGTIPFLGRIFRSPETKSSQREIVVVITPELVGQDQQDAVERGRTVEQALASTPAMAEVTLPSVAVSAEDPARRYAVQVQERIAGALRYPEFERQQGVGGQVVLRLHLFRDGALAHAIVSQSSGIEAFDQEAVKAAQAQAPYPAFPPALEQSDLWLELPVLFQP